MTLESNRRRRSRRQKLRPKWHQEWPTQSQPFRGWYRVLHYILCIVDLENTLEVVNYRIIFSVFYTFCVGHHQLDLCRNFLSWCFFSWHLHGSIMWHDYCWKISIVRTINFFSHTGEMRGLLYSMCVLVCMYSHYMGYKYVLIMETKNLRHRLLRNSDSVRSRRNYQIFLIRFIYIRGWCVCIVGVCLCVKVETKNYVTTCVNALFYLNDLLKFEIVLTNCRYLCSKKKKNDSL